MSNNELKGGLFDLDKILDYWLLLVLSFHRLVDPSVEDLIWVIITDEMDTCRILFYYSPPKNRYRNIKYITVVDGIRNRFY